MKDFLIRQIKAYTPHNEQEEVDKALFLRFLETSEADLSRRESLAAHLTASAWVVSPDRQQVLMAYHNLYDSWAWLGGHADGNWNLLQVAEKEAREESGIRSLRPVTEDILSLEILTVSGHEKKGKYLSSHLHLNLTYLFEAGPGEPLRIKADENSAVGWIDIDKLADSVSEPPMLPIYERLLKRANDC